MAGETRVVHNVPVANVTRVRHDVHGVGADARATSRPAGPPPMDPRMRVRSLGPIDGLPAAAAGTKGSPIAKKTDLGPISEADRLALGGASTKLSAGKQLAASAMAIQTTLSLLSEEDRKEFYASMGERVTTPEESGSR
jgi:hypothetical protein